MPSRLSLIVLPWQSVNNSFVDAQGQEVPSIVGVCTCFGDLMPFIAMELVDGILLDSALQEGRPSADDAAVMVQVRLVTPAASACAC